MVATEDPVRQKIGSIRAGGLAAARGGKVTLFKGFPTDIAHRVNVSILATRDNNVVQVAQTAYHNAYASELTPLTANIDYVAHCTMLEAIAPPNWAGIKKAETIKDLMKILIVSKNPVARHSGIQFDEFVVNGKCETLLMAHTIPDPILELREILGEYYAGQGFQVLPMNDILHMTIQRIWDRPDVTGEQIRTYVERFNRQPDYLPTSIRVGNFYAGSAKDLLDLMPN